MTLSGGKSGTTITDASGNYTFTGLDNGSYTVTPSRTGFTVQSDGQHANHQLRYTWTAGTSNDLLGNYPYRP